MADEIAIRDWLKIKIRGRQFPEARDSLDGNWLDVRITFSDLMSQVELSGSILRTDELRRIMLDAEKLLETKVIAMTFEPMEAYWGFEICALGRYGHFLLKLQAKGYPCNSTAIRANHSYEFSIDQTDLQILVREIRSTLREFPVIV